MSPAPTARILVVVAGALVVGCGWFVAPLGMAAAAVPPRGDGAYGARVQHAVEAVFPFGQAWRREANRARWNLLGALPDSVVRGQDGWLFYRSEVVDDTHSFDDWRGLAGPDAALAERWRAVLGQRHRDLAAQGVRYVPVVVPDKQRALAHLLPPDLAAAHRPGRLEALAGICAQEGIPWLDLGPALGSDPAHWSRSDSHWSDLGAYVGYRALISHLGQQPLPPGALRPRLVEGDIIRMARLDLREDVSWLDPVAAYPACVADGRPVLATGASAMDRFYQCTTEVDGHRELVCSQDAPGLPSAVVFHDSMMPALGPWLAQHFRRVRFVWHAFDPAVVAAERPDLVLHVYVQRGIGYFERTRSR
jgi:hypothetical protein